MSQFTHLVVGRIQFLLGCWTEALVLDAWLAGGFQLLAPSASPQSTSQHGILLHRASDRIRQRRASAQRSLQDGSHSLLKTNHRSDILQLLSYLICKKAVTGSSPHSGHRIPHRQEFQEEGIIESLARS